MDDRVRASPPATLSYGVGAPRRRGPTWRHAAVAVLLTLGVAGSWGVGRTAQAAVERAADVRAAAGHVEPAADVLFDADPAVPIEAGHERLAFPTDPPTPGGPLSPAARPDPDSYAGLRDALGAAADALDDYGVLLFLHELTAPSGTKRLVAVRFLPWVVEGEAVPDGWRAGTSAGLVAHVFDPGGLIDRPAPLGESTAPMLMPMSDPSLSFGGAYDPFDPYRAVRDARLRWFAGQPDVTDAAHFTLDFEHLGVRGTVDGYLSADGSAVHMHVRRPDAGRAATTTGVGLPR